MQRGGVVAISIVLGLLVLGALVYVGYTFLTKKGLFKSYKPKLAVGLIQAFPDERYAPLSEEDQAKKLEMLKLAKQRVADIKIRRLEERRAVERG